jgi:phage terminase small subunit
MTNAARKLSKNLTAKQAAFVDEYLIDLNATRAYRKIYGVSEKVAAPAAARLLRNVKVAAAVEAALAKRSERTKVTQDYVLTNLVEIVERCMERAPVMVREDRHMVQKVDDDGNDVWQFDSRGATSALTLMARHLGMFVDKTELVGRNGEPFKVQVVYSRE